jgi:hypothetical protein
MKIRTVNKSWYYYIYRDVKISKIDAKLHFSTYGFSESRIANPFYLIKSFPLRVIAHFLHFFGIKIYDANLYPSRLEKIFMNYFYQLFIKTEFPFLADVKGLRTKIYLTSWVGGGVEQAVKLYIERDLKSFDAVLVIRSIKNIDSKKFPVFEVDFISRQTYKSFKNICIIPYPFLKALTDSKLFESVAIHHVFGFENMIEFVLDNFDKTIDFYFHDYYLFSDNWSFYNISLDKDSPQEDLINTYANRAWSLDSRKNLTKRANCIIATSYHSFTLLSSQINIAKHKLEFEYIPEEVNLEFNSVNLRLPETRSIKVLILGNLGVYKGLLVLNDLVELLSSSDNFSFHHIGSVSEGNLHPKIESYGWLNNEARDTQIKHIDADVALLISQCPETYCLVLSDLIRIRIPIIASKIGAISERIYDRENTLLIENYADSLNWVDALQEFGQKWTLKAVNRELFTLDEERILHSKRKRQEL